MKSTMRITESGNAHGAIDCYTLIIYIYMPAAPETAKKAGSARVQGPPFRRAAIFAMAARKYARGRND